ncbi:hypothetical protein GQX74_014227 [Glossina fuscipes]|nr:hypothetical protein GQX74_014227 [Glossina fuscipes]
MQNTLQIDHSFSRYIASICLLQRPKAFLGDILWCRDGLSMGLSMISLLPTLSRTKVQSKDCESCADVPTQKQCGMITLMCGTTVKCVFANDCQMLQRKCLFGETWKKMDTVECKQTSPKCVQFGLLS